MLFDFTETNRLFVSVKAGRHTALNFCCQSKIPSPPSRDAIVNSVIHAERLGNETHFTGLTTSQTNRWPRFWQVLRHCRAHRPVCWRRHLYNAPSGCVDIRRRVIFYCGNDVPSSEWIRNLSVFFNCAIRLCGKQRMCGTWMFSSS